MTHLTRAKQVEYAVKMAEVAQDWYDVTDNEDEQRALQKLPDILMLVFKAGELVAWSARYQAAGLRLCKTKGADAWLAWDHRVKEFALLESFIQGLRPVTRYFFKLTPDGTYEPFSL